MACENISDLIALCKGPNRKEKLKSVTKDTMADILESLDVNDPTASVRDASLNEMKEMMAALAHEIRQSNELYKHSLSEMNKEVDDLKTKLKHTNDKLTDAINKIDYLENQSRRNNLRFDGIPEDRNESWETTEIKVRETLKSKLNLTQREAETIPIERAHRTGPRPTNGSLGRTIIAKFASFKDRAHIIKKVKERKPVGLYVNEDFSKKVADRRKSLLPEMIRHREAGKIAYLSFDKLVVRDRTPTYATAAAAANPSAEATID